MPQTRHVDKHFTASESVRYSVIGISGGLSVPFALTAGRSGDLLPSIMIITAQACPEKCLDHRPILCHGWTRAVGPLLLPAECPPCPDRIGVCHPLGSPGIWLHQGTVHDAPAFPQCVANRGRRWACSQRSFRD